MDPNMVDSLKQSLQGCQARSSPLLEEALSSISGSFQPPAEQPLAVSGHQDDSGKISFLGGLQGAPDPWDPGGNSGLFEPVFPSLVDKGHNSSSTSHDEVIDFEPVILKRYKRLECPHSAGWMRGRCEHGNERWIHLDCKRRDCPVCGEIRRRRIAWRVEYGLQVLGPGAWVIVTWDWDIPKAEAVKTQNKLIKWIRRELGVRVEYAAVWEDTKKGRLHLNLILSPWRYINQRLLSQKCVDFGAGPVVWVEKVEGGIGGEVSKLRYKLGNYMAKFEQQVQEGRGINYSHGWPRLPEDPYRRLGRITWTWMDPMYDETEIFEEDVEVGLWGEILPGEYARCAEHELCDCFDFVLRGHRARDSCSEILKCQT
jgi:hypothetical protein